MSRRHSPTRWSRLPYSWQLAVTIVLSAVSFSACYALVTVIQSALWH